MGQGHGEPCELYQYFEGDSVMVRETREQFEDGEDVINLMTPGCKACSSILDTLGLLMS